MILASSILGSASWRKAISWPGLVLSVLLLVASSCSLLAEGTNAAPVQPASAPAAAPGHEDFGQYLADHEADLAPVFDKHIDELAKEAVPLLLGMMGSVIILNLIVSWVFDIGLAFGFSKLFAPLYAKFKQALIFATGSLVLGVVLGVLTGLAAFAVSGINPLAIIGVVALAVLIYLAAQTLLVSAIYRTTVMVSILFCVGLVLVHGIAGTVVAAPLIKARTGAMVTQFIDQNITTMLKNATAESKHDLGEVQTALENAKAEQADAQNRIDQANTEQKTLSQEIESKKNSEPYIYGQIAKVHAQGNITAARDQLTAFLARFPAGALVSSAQTQLTEVNNEIAAQDAQKKQAEADAAQAVAQARADLLARAAKGEVTLSEMRQALIGRSRTYVTGLFGDPTEIGSDRWGYGQQMVFDPMTNERHGLTVYFTEGAVQGVDFYYGTGGAK